jgi:hypothetical protein
MSQTDNSAGRWWHGLFANWIFHGPDGRNAVRAWAWTLVFGVLLVIGGLGYGPPGAGDYQTFSLWRWVLALAPVVPGVVAAFAWRRFIHNAEELLERVYTQAAGFAFSVAIVLFLGIFIAGRIFGEAEAADASQLAFTVVLVTFVFGVQHRLRQFNA